MTITAQSIIQEAQEILQDIAGVRWAATELVAHLNDGQRELATLRPDWYATNAALVLALGAKQALPVACVNFMDITRNTNGPAITQVEQRMLDAIDRSWYTKTPVAVIKHFTYDPRNRDVLFVYPPAIAGTSVDAVYSVMPADIPAPGGAPYTTVNGTLTGKDSIKNPLLHFVLFRAFAKDAEFGGNATMSASHYQLFVSLVGGSAATGAAVKPEVTE